MSSWTPSTAVIVVELFKDVPVHRANFLYKVHRRY